MDGRPDRAGAGHPAGGLRGLAARQLPVAGGDDGLIAGRVAAQLPDRHPADPGVCGAAEVAASFGRGDVVALGPFTTGLLTVDGLRHLLAAGNHLVAVPDGAGAAAGAQRVLEVLRTDYIKFARARGLPDRKVYFGHALKNTLVPVITIAGLQLGGIIAFAIVTETVFQWPGMGLLFIQAVRLPTSRDGGLPVPDRADLRLHQPGRSICCIFAVDPRLRIERGAAGH